MSILEAVKRRASFIAILLISTCAVSAQAPPSQVELNGFLLGQYKTVLEPTFGTPYDETKTEDGWVYLTYMLRDDSSGYMTFRFSSEEPNRMYSIQIAGDASIQMTPFLGLRLGDSKTKVDEALGPPSEVRKVPDFDLYFYLYENRNYSIEIDAEGKLSSIQLFGYEGLPERPDNPIPDPSILRDCVVQRTEGCLMGLLAPDIEIYKDGDTYTFQTAARKDLENLESPLLRSLVGENKSLRAVWVDEELEGELEWRLYTKAPLGSVLKFYQSKIVSEVVFRTYAGEWRIYEVRFR